MSNLQSILENVDTPELLCQSVKCILQVARCYPHVFSTNFRVSVLDVTGHLHGYLCKGSFLYRSGPFGTRSLNTELFENSCKDEGI